METADNQQMIGLRGKALMPSPAPSACVHSDNLFPIRIEGLASELTLTVSLCPFRAIQQPRGKNVDLQTIAVLTRLSVRKVRYVLDHRLLPGLRIAGQPDLVGRARVLTDLEGFSVACAAILLEAGVRKKSVVDFMTGLAQFPWDIGRKRRHPTYAIQKAFEPRVTPAEASLGDGINLRFQLGDTDSGWMQPGTYAPLADEYQPRVVIRIDLARLRDVFLDHR